MALTFHEATRGRVTVELNPELADVLVIQGGLASTPLLRWNT